MSAPTLRSTTILTEHLQYPPISLVDDIINAVNEIMYKCTAAMEKYLLGKSTIDGVDYTDEVKIGIGKLETLLEYSVDKNFDKFELYVLRNILRIPNELLDENVFRLENQRDLIIGTEEEISKSKALLNEKIQLIEEAFYLNKQLQGKYKQLRRLHDKVQKFKLLVLQVLNCDHSDIAKELYNTLKPIDDSMKFLTTKLRQMYIESEKYASLEQVQNLSSNESDSIRSTDAANLQTLSRSKYIDARVKQILTQSHLNDIESSIITEPITNDINIKNPDLAALESQLK